MSGSDFLRFLMGLLCLRWPCFSFRWDYHYRFYILHSFSSRWGTLSAGNLLFR